MSEGFSDDLINEIRQSKGVKTLGNLTVSLPQYFGFCGGVNRAINKILENIKSNNSEKKITLLGEIIHNNTVNDYLLKNGVEICARTNNKPDLNNIEDGNIVVIPTFGMEAMQQEELSVKLSKSTIVDTTCSYVRKIWQITDEHCDENCTIILYGKPNHNEVISIVSHILSKNNDIAIVILPSFKLLPKLKKSLEEGIVDEELPIFNKHNFINKKYVMFNQTTMLHQQVIDVGCSLKNFVESLGIEFKQIDTVCTATKLRQEAARNLLEKPCDFVLVVGGFDSSNTTELYNIAKDRHKTYFIQDDEDFDGEKIKSWDPILKKVVVEKWHLSKGKKIAISILSGASCPDKDVGQVIRKLYLLLHP